MYSYMMHIVSFPVDSGGQKNVIIVILKSLKLMSLAPPLWIVYRILKNSLFLRKKVNMLKYSSKNTSTSDIYPPRLWHLTLFFSSPGEFKESDHDISLLELTTEDTTVDLRKTRGIG